jgi:hypothetical protein
VKAAAAERHARRADPDRGRRHAHARA